MAGDPFRGLKPGNRVDAQQPADASRAVSPGFPSSLSQCSATRCFCEPLCNDLRWLVYSKCAFGGRHSPWQAVLFDPWGPGAPGDWRSVWLCLQTLLVVNDR